MAKKRKIGVVTTSRADLGIYRNVLAELSRRKNIELSIYIGGDHAASGSMKEIRKLGINIDAVLDAMPAAHNEEDITRSIAAATRGFGATFARNKPDILLVLGDRYEMHAAAVAALPFGIAVAHIHGGEETLGAFDNSLRHSMTKLSHIHFVSTALAKKRVRQMGENPKNIIVSGAPALDNAKNFRLLSKDEFYKKYNIPAKRDFALVTFHPVTLESQNTKKYINNLLAALKGQKLFMVFTAANKDTFGNIINDAVKVFAKNNDALFIESFGSENYFAAMKHASVMIGNSSSGILEAGIFSLPVVNIGSRQQGRESGRNVIHTGYSAAEIKTAISKALTLKRAKIKSIYGSGNAGKIIADKLEKISLKDILIKRFYLNGN